MERVCHLTVSNHGPRRPQTCDDSDPTRFFVQLPPSISQSGLRHLRLAGACIPSHTRAVAPRCGLAWQPPALLPGRLTFTLRVVFHDAEARDDIETVLDVPPTMCALEPTGATAGTTPVLRPADGGAHALVLQDQPMWRAARLLVGTAEPGGTGAVPVTTDTDLRAADGATTTTTTGVYLFTPPVPSLDLLLSCLSQLISQAPASQVLAVARVDGTVCLRRNAQAAVRSVSIACTGGGATALGVSGVHVIPVAKDHECVLRSNLVCHSVLATGAATPSRVVGFLTNTSRLQVMQPIAEAIRIEDDNGFAYTCGWPAGVFDTASLVDTFNSQVATAQAALPGGSSWPGVTASWSDSSGLVTLTVDGARRFSVQFIDARIQMALGFERTQYSWVRVLVGTIPRAGPSGGVGLLASFSDATQRLHVQPFMQAACRLEPEAGVAVATTRFVAGASEPWVHGFVPGDAATVTTVGGTTYTCLVGPATTATALEVVPPHGVTINTECTVRPCGSASLRWVFGRRALGKRLDTMATSICGLNPHANLGVGVFTGGEMPYRTNLHPCRDVAVVVEGMGVACESSHIIRSRGGADFAVLAHMVFDRTTSVLDVRESDIGMRVHGRRGSQVNGMWVRLVDPDTGDSADIEGVEVRLTFAFTLQSSAPRRVGTSSRI